MGNFTMDDILGSSLGSDGSEEIRVIFQKKTAVKQYEPELVEVESTLRVPKNLKGPERMLVSAILLSQVEYTCFVQLLAKKQVTADEFNLRKKELEGAINALAKKYKDLTGEEPTEYLEKL